MALRAFSDQKIDLQGGILLDKYKKLNPNGMLSPHWTLIFWKSGCFLTINRCLAFRHCEKSCYFTARNLPLVAYRSWHDYDIQLLAALQRNMRPLEEHRFRDNATEIVEIGL